jgi:hypothetical protein
MPNDPADGNADEDTLDNCVADALTNNFERMCNIALCELMEQKGAPLDDDEVDAVLAQCGFYYGASLHGCDPHILAAAMRQEARGTQTYH